MLAALAVVGLQVGAVAQGGAPRAPDDALTLGAGIAISQCIMMRESEASPAAFVAAVGPLRQRLAADPRLSGVTVDDAAGRGCRVSFTGTSTDADLMAARAKMAPNQLLFTRRPLPGGGERISTTLIYPTRPTGPN
jgi:hypothetical protein